MGLFFDDFNFDDIFSKTWSVFNRPVKDMYPYQAFKNENGYIIVCNTLGIDKKDLYVGIEKEKGKPYPILKIKGTTHIERIDYDNSVDLGIALKFDSQILSIKYEVTNGLTIVYLKTSEPMKRPALEAEYIEPTDEDFDW